MIAAGAEAFLSTQGDLAGIQQVAEELPSRRCFKAVDAQILGHHIHCRAGGHGSGNARQSSGIPRGKGGVGREHREAVAGIHEAAMAQDHVAVTVSVAGGAEPVAITLEQELREVVGVGQVGVRVSLAEVLEGDAIAHAAGRCPEQLFEHPFGVRPRHGMHGIKGQRKVALEQLADLIEIKQLLHQGNKVIDAIDDFNLHRTDLVRSRLFEAEGLCLGDRVLLQGFRALENRIREGAGRGTTIGAIHLHAEVAVGTTGVVAGGKNDASDRLPLADQVGGCGRRQDAACGDHHLAEAMGCPHAQDHVDGAPVAVATVATEHEGAALHARQGSEHRFDKALEVVRLLELLAALAQSRGAGFLVSERSVESHDGVRGLGRGGGSHPGRVGRI